jgi:hypothetical protein
LDPEKGPWNGRGPKKHTPAESYQPDDTSFALHHLMCEEHEWSLEKEAETIGKTRYC